ncbi:MAG: hypothetical protein AOA65_1341 [Candidatus Bathyarchaeota archaeon BA1]|nr:MAG: hypothetical protein AOA65_1341 [Candidatus Bathyarchaeota archaeon BA1]
MNLTGFPFFRKYVCSTFTCASDIRSIDRSIEPIRIMIYGQLVEEKKEGLGISSLRYVC